MSGSDFGEWYHSIPQLTKYWFTASVVVPLAGRFGVFTYQTMMLNWHLFFHNFHIWRPLTAAIYYPITPRTGFHYLITLYFLYSYSQRLETGLFIGRPGDYAYLLLINWLSSVIFGFILGFPILWDILVFSVIYIWCSINKDMIVSFWFGTKFRAIYLPWVLFAFNFIISGGGMGELMGIFIGHIYFFLKFKYPQDFGGRSLLETPQIMYKYFPNWRNTVSGFGSQPTSGRRMEPQNNGGGGGGDHRWGRGNRLGE